MPVICLEGASAVGKTTTSRLFQEKHGAFVVPEVNQLFERPANESAEWYFERQVERWRIAREEGKTHRFVVLDGDPFQPLWYNWAYDYADWQDLNFMERFYKPGIEGKIIGFPDLYFILGASEAELRKRRAGDRTRQRRGFETHLRMIEPQRRYFRAMRSFSPRRVVFLNAESAEKNVEFIFRELSAPALPGEGETEYLFDKLVEWLRANSPR